MRRLSPKPVGRVDITTLAKAFAICMVVLTHAGWTEADRLCPIFPFVVNSAVPLFMMVTGLNYARSYRRRRADSLVAMYAPSLMKRRVFGLVLPFIPVFLFEVLLAVFRNQFRSAPIDLSASGLILGFVSGGWGPGGYYLPVMIQVILVHPVLYLAASRSRTRWGLFLAVSCGCLVFDCVLTSLGFPMDVWRLLCFRYLPYLAFGITLASGIGTADGKVHLALLALGGGYLACLEYGMLPESLAGLSFGWSDTSVPAALFFMGVFGLLYGRYNDFKPMGSKWRIIELIASNTWFIFLVQSAWFFAGANSLLGFLPTPVSALVHLVICVPMGCVFGQLWKSLTKRVGKSVDARKCKLRRAL